MDSIKQFLSYMNDVNFKYVVLRNWDSLPYDIKLGEHSDLDLLVYDFSHFFEIFSAAKLENSYPRVRTKIPVDDSYIYVDVRHIGDDYYPVDFEKAILETREWNERGFWTPDALHHTIGLAYHAIHHKNFISPEYKRWLGDAKPDELLTSLKNSNVGWIKPKDPTVGSYNPYWKGATSIVEKQGDYYFKKQLNYLEYPLIENEAYFLERLACSHFPLCKRVDGGLLVEDCGQPLTVDNLPENWREQLALILQQLENSRIQHRDIRLDNLTVKDGRIHLIDFGWAVWNTEKGEQFESIEKNAPSCLGFPNKASFGFSDSYSMGCIMRQLEYQLEGVAA